MSTPPPAESSGPTTAEERTAEVRRLLDFAGASRVPAGFGWLDTAGRLDAARPVELWISCRMTHVHALASVLDPDPRWEAMLDHGVATLLAPGALHDAAHGGWFAAVAADGSAILNSAKQAYAHAFVVLAGASATGAGHPDGARLLAEALEVLRERFWDDAADMVVETYDAPFAELDPYRGLNANMHAVEALLAAHDATGDPWPLEAAARIGDRVAHDLGPAFGWRLPEHFDAAWTPQPDLNRERPADPFRPYGVTVGHLFEWARLLTHLDLARGHTAAASAAGALYDRACEAWGADTVPGFAYTTDFEGAPVVRSRMHWVIAEAMAAATALGRPDDEARFTAFAWQHHRDAVGGSWWHELDADLTPSTTVWPGKPDVYHALQALWLPRLWPCASFVVGEGGGSSVSPVHRRN